MAFTNGKRHDLHLFKECKIKIHLKAITDTAYQGLQKIHSNTSMPKKKTKKRSRCQKKIKKNNKYQSSKRVLNENAVCLSCFKIIA